MKAQSREFLFDLLGTPSPSGFEAAGQRKWMAAVRPVADRVESDAYGTAWATRTGAADPAPTVMLEAHADEIGFMIQQIDEDGFIRVSRIGGADRAIARGKRVSIFGDAGPVPGIVGNTAIHLRDKKIDKVPELHELFVDVGAKNPEEVAALGLRVGHPMVYADGAEELAGGRLVGRALDNRIGGFIIAEVLRRLAATDRTAATVYAVNSVQEEIGGHGAKMVAYRLHPSVAVVLDVTHATDSPGIEEAKHGEVKLGEGPTVTHGSCNHPEVVRRILAVAGECEIPVQHEAASLFTGTDTDGVFVARTGVPSALVSLPMRYMHSTVETVDLADVESCIRLLEAFARSVQADDEFRVDLK